MFLPRKGRSSLPHFLLSLEESPGPTKLWKSFLLLTAVDSSGPAAEAARAVPGGQHGHGNAAQGKGPVGQSRRLGCPRLCCCSGQRWPHWSSTGEGGSAPGPVGTLGMERGMMGRPPHSAATSAALVFPFLLAQFLHVSRPPCREDGARKREAAFM